MEEIIDNTAKTTEVDNESVEVNEESSVAVDDDGVNADFTDTQVEEEEVVDKHVQSEEENKEFARKRREAETKAKIEQAREEARIETIIELKKTNPYTGKTLRNAKDVKIMELMEECEANGGDPLDEMDSIYEQVYSNQPTKPKQEQESNSNVDTEVQEDIANFKASYPDVDYNALFNDEKFKSYCEGKLGNKPLSEIYGDFSRLFIEPKKKAVKQAVNKSAVGSLTGEQTPSEGILSIEKMKSMTEDEIGANWDLINKSLAYWHKHK